MPRTDPHLSTPLGATAGPFLPPSPELRSHRGRSVRLDPFHSEDTDALWRAAEEAEASWAYLRYGPFETFEAFADQLRRLSEREDLRFFVVRPGASGEAEGWLSYCSIAPTDAALELGGIWFSPRLQRTRAATEALALLLRHAFDDLGYRRVAWRCNALNQASLQAAKRLGFTCEGVWRDAEIVKGHRRSTAWFSLLQPEWTRVSAALETWLDDANFDSRGRARRSLSALTRTGPSRG